MKSAWVAGEIKNLQIYSCVFVFVLLWEYSAAQAKEVDNRILGGYETKIENFPYQLALEGGRHHLCGGSILSNVWALTAAHCVYDQPVRWLQCRAGSSQREKGGTVHQVKFYIYHEKYSRQTLDYDVAVVNVRVPFKFQSGVYPVFLPVLIPVQGEPVTVTGWGYMDKQLVEKPKQLTAADIVIRSWDECKKIYPALTLRMMCAGETDKNICNGDSGGPLARGNSQQVGIVSWAYKCGNELPSVYTNLSSVLPWVRSSTGIEESLLFMD